MNSETENLSEIVEKCYCKGNFKIVFLLLFIFVFCCCFFTFCITPAYNSFICNFIFTLNHTHPLFFFPQPPFLCMFVNVILFGSGFSYTMHKIVLRLKNIRYSNMCVCVRAPTIATFRDAMEYFPQH